MLFFLFGLNNNARAYYPVSATQGQPYSAYNSVEDNYLVAWTDCRSLPSSEHCCCYGSRDGQDVYGQIVNKDGGCIGANFPIATGPAGQQYPGVAYNPDKNEYLVVWQGLRRDFLSGGGPARPAGGDFEAEFQKKGYDIFGQRVAANGALIGGQIRISRLDGGNPATDDDDEQWHPRVAYSPEHGGRYMVVWHDGRARQLYPDLFSENKTTFKDIYGQILDGSGGLVGKNFPVSIDSENSEHQIYGNAQRIQQYAEITYDPNRKRFLVVWEDNRNGSGSPLPPGPGKRYDALNFDIWAGFFDANGQRIGPNFPVSQSTEAERYPQLAYLESANQFLVVWQGDVTNYLGLTPASYIKVYGQRIDTANGSLVGDKITFESQAKIHDQYVDNGYAPQARVSVDLKAGKYRVIWGKSSPGTTGYSLKEAMVGSLGGVSGMSTLQGSMLGHCVSGRLRAESSDFLTGMTLWGEGPFVAYRTTAFTEGRNCPATGSLPPTPTSPPLTPTGTISPTATPTGSPCLHGELGNLDCDSGGLIDEADLSILLGLWNPSGSVGGEADLNHDQKVDEADLSILLGNWDTQH